MTSTEPPLKKQKTENNQSFSLFELALKLFEDARYEESLHLLHAVRIQLETTHNNIEFETQEYSNVLRHISLVLIELRKDEEAWEICEKALKIQEKISTEKNLYSAILMVDLANIADHKEEFQNALDLISKSKAIIENSIGTKNLEFARCLRVFGGICDDMKQHEQSLIYLKEAMEILRSLNLTETFEYYFSLLSYFFACSNVPNKHTLDELEKMLVECCEISQRMHGSQHVRFARCRRALAHCYAQQKRFPEACKILEECLTIQRKTFGFYHPTVAVTLEKLACYTNSYPIGIDSYRKLKEIYIHLYGRSNRDYIQSCIDLARLLKDSKKFEEALSELIEIIEFKDVKNGFVLSREILEEIQFQFGEIHQQLKGWPQARSAFSLALDLRKTRLGEKHLKCAQIYLRLGICFWFEDQYPQAIQHFEQVKAIHERAEIKDSELARALFYTGSSYRLTKQLDLSISILEQCHALESTLPDSNDMEITLSELAVAYRLNSDPENSLRCLKKARTICESRKMGGAPYADVLCELGLHYRYVSDFAEALKFFNESLTITRKIKASTKDIQLHIRETYFSLSAISTLSSDLWMAFDDERGALHISSKRMNLARRNLVGLAISLRLDYSIPTNFVINDKFIQRILQLADNSDENESENPNSPKNSDAEDDEDQEDEDDLSPMKSKPYLLYLALILLRAKLAHEIHPTVTKQLLPSIMFTQLIPISWKRITKIIRWCRLIVALNSSVSPKMQNVLTCVVRMASTDQTTSQLFVSKILQFALDKKTLGTRKSDFFRSKMLTLEGSNWFPIYFQTIASLCANLPHWLKGSDYNLKRQRDWIFQFL